MGGVSVYANGTNVNGVGALEGGKTIKMGKGPSEKDKNSKDSGCCS